MLCFRTSYLNNLSLLYFAKGYSSAWMMLTWLKKKVCLISPKWQNLMSGTDAESRVVVSVHFCPASGDSRQEKNNIVGHVLGFEQSWFSVTGLEKAAILQRRGSFLGRRWQASWKRLEHGFFVSTLVMVGGRCLAGGQDPAGAVQSPSSALRDPGPGSLAPGGACVPLMPRSSDAVSLNPGPCGILLCFLTFLKAFPGLL